MRFPSHKLTQEIITAIKNEHEPALIPLDTSYEHHSEDIFAGTLEKSLRHLFHLKAWYITHEPTIFEVTHHQDNFTFIRKFYRALLNQWIVQAGYDLRYRVWVMPHGQVMLKRPAHDTSNDRSTSEGLVAAPEDFCDDRE